MSDTYQPIYDAVRSRLSNCDVGQAVQDALSRENFSFYVGNAVATIGYSCAKVEEAAAEHARPSAVYKPAISIDGNMWCALYGDNLQDGVAGFGKSPSEAMDAFDKAWNEALK